MRFSTSRLTERIHPLMTTMKNLIKFAIGIIITTINYEDLIGLHGRATKATGEPKNHKTVRKR